MDSVEGKAVEDATTHPVDANDLDEDGDFQDWSEEEDSERIQSLFCSTLLPSVSALIDHDLQHFNFDLKSIVSTVCSDEISFIKLVNFIRKQVKDRTEGELNIQDLQAQINNKEFLDDKNMIPFLDSDPLLYLFEESFEFAEEEPASTGSVSSTTAAATDDAEILDAIASEGR
jgi:hypothetical protein